MLTEGRPFPLGATAGPAGINFALAAPGATRWLADATSIGFAIVRRRASTIRPPPTTVVFSDDL